jgi:hypothetical protein
MKRKPIKAARSHSSGTALRHSRSGRIAANYGALKARLDTLTEQDPDEAMLEANQLITLGVDTLLSLVRSGTLYHAGGDLDLAEGCLCVQAERLARELCVLSKNYRREPIAAIWDVAVECATAIFDLASTTALRAKPQSDLKLYALQTVARDRLFMPTFRARRGGFEQDFDQIAETVGLSDACGFNTEANAKYRPDTSATKFIMLLVSRVEARRRRLNQEYALFDIESKRNRPAEEARSFESWLVENHPDAAPDLIQLHKLGPLDNTSRDQWWRVIQAELEKPEVLDSVRGTKFWVELSRVKKGKDYEVRDELKRRCKQAFLASSFVRDSYSGAPKIR